MRPVKSALAWGALVVGIAGVAAMAMSRGSIPPRSSRHNAAAADASPTETQTGAAGTLTGGPSATPAAWVPLMPYVPSRSAACERYETQASLIPQPSQPSAAWLCHAMRLHPAGEVLANGRSILDLLTDERAGAPLIMTRNGVAYVLASAALNVPADGESHRDIVLASFAEAGAPLSTPIHVNNTTRNLQDVLADAAATFDIKAEELEWTAMAFAAYIPPRAGWVTREGTAFTLEDLAVELLERASPPRGCIGVHRALALTALYTAEPARRILSRETADRISVYLRRTVVDVVENQHADGSWGFDWNHGGTDQAPGGHPPHSAFEALLMTGHVLEWLHALPDDLRPSRAVYVSGGKAVREILGVAQQEMGICPLTHASRAAGLAPCGTCAQCVSDLASPPSSGLAGRNGAAVSVVFDVPTGPS